MRSFVSTASCPTLLYGVCDGLVSMYTVHRGTVAVVHCNSLGLGPGCIQYWQSLKHRRALSSLENTKLSPVLSFLLHLLQHRQLAWNVCMTRRYTGGTSSHDTFLKYHTLKDTAVSVKGECYMQ